MNKQNRNRPAGAADLLIQRTSKCRVSQAPQRPAGGGASGRWGAGRAAGGGRGGPRPRARRPAGRGAIAVYATLFTSCYLPFLLICLCIAYYL